MNAPTAWGAVQDVAYHLERAVTKELGVLLLAGGGLFPQARAVLREAGDRVQMAHRDVEAVEAKSKKRKEARAGVLRLLREAEERGAEAAALLFRENVRAKDVAAIHAAVADAIRLEVEALQGLLALRD